MSISPIVHAKCSSRSPAKPVRPEWAALPNSVASRVPLCVSLDFLPLQLPPHPTVFFSPSFSPPPSVGSSSATASHETFRFACYARALELGFPSAIGASRSDVKQQLTCAPAPPTPTQTHGTLAVATGSIRISNCGANLHPRPGRRLQVLGLLT